MPVRRAVKNIVKNYTEAEVKVREATSNDPWGPSSTLMSEIADLTYNVVAFTEIMAMVWKRLNDHGKNWRHVYKSLTLLEYIIKTGSEKVGQQCKENIYAIQTLKDFQHMEDNKDLGANVREKAKGLVSLLKDDERLKNERTKALKAKERFTENFGIGSDSTHTQLGKPKHGRHITYKDESRSTPSNLQPELEEARPHSAGEEQLQLELALAMSKEEADSVAEKKNNDDVKLQLALEESKKQEEVDRKTDPDVPELGNLAATGGPSNDPWDPSAPSIAPANPWSPVPAISLTSQNPWSPPATAQSNQWETIPAQPSATDPWGDNSGSAASASTVNAWSSQPQSHGLQAAEVLSTDPWLASSSDNGAKFTPKSVMDNDFELLSSRQPSTNPPPADQMAIMSLMDPNPANLLGPPAVKKPEDFLDPHAKNLVNLDSLVSKTAAPDPGASNPFAMTAVGQNQPLVANPFTANQPPRPSLNQMSQAAVPGFTQQQQMLPNPMIPTDGFQPMGYNQPAMGYQPPPYQTQQTNVNPFL